MRILRKKEWEEIQSKIFHLECKEEEFEFVKKCQEIRGIGCKHKQHVLIMNLPMNCFHYIYCMECGDFTAVTCTCGGSGYLCKKHAEEFAKKVEFI